MINYVSSQGFFTGNQHVTVAYPANCVILYHNCAIIASLFCSEWADIYHKINELMCVWSKISERLDDYLHIWKYSEGKMGFPVKYPDPMAEDLLNNREKVVGELVGEIRKAINKMKKILKKGP